MNGGGGAGSKPDGGGKCVQKREWVVGPIWIMKTCMQMFKDPKGPEDPKDSKESLESWGSLGPLEFLNIRKWIVGTVPDPNSMGMENAFGRGMRWSSRLDS